MTALFQARLKLDERLTAAELAGFETVFSELLDAAATVRGNAPLCKRRVAVSPRERKCQR